MADCGLTGRKIIVDTYGGAAPHGGGAFSGKDPTKVDRSASYALRHVAKNIVAAGLAEKCLVQAAYAIGVAEPVSLMINTYGTGKADDETMTIRIRECFDLTPAGIIQSLNLWRPIYRQRRHTVILAVWENVFRGKKQTASLIYRTRKMPSPGLDIFSRDHIM